MNGIGIVVNLQDAEMASFMSHVSWSWLVAVAFLARSESPPKFQETFLLSETCQISKSFLLS
jgi:hypothetical protein